MTGAKAQARDWRAFSVRWKRHQRDAVRIHNGTWRAKAYCFEQGDRCATVLTLFPDNSGGYRTCSKCGHVYGVGEF
jgi:hypothetical protein